ncbi:sugar phosphate isomerase/epimerase [Spirosoma sp. KCTC 42546]|uniref:sugar phosphate isomerase/epimerase family protein n=1 Tax=Spirosoma sp. KCTC 42546 TaxID=2520506 RepID=UPI0011582C68|nr:sugar phosphate isomerase/epimerase family protein [Spirosoma sp. KCTC 42546]QDK77792.1 sugar phosphate isomerase/epimerase [Spirosoma sp. KCTC 42546]
MQADKRIKRRDFLTYTTGILAGLPTFNILGQPSSSDVPAAGFTLPLGVCTSYDKAGLLKRLGYSFVEESVGRFLIPDEGGDAQFEKNRLALAEETFPVRSYIYFFPGKLKSVGPDLHHEAILARAEVALKRAKECGSKNIVFGSGGSRAIPDGFDRATAKAQHIALCQKMAPLAEKYGVTLAVEPLNRSETNFINSLAEGVEIIQAVNNPWFKLQCDIYHMLKDNESPDEIVKYGQYITHCHIAEKQKRTAPGVMGDDFRPYFRALKKIKYTGGLSLECVWTDFDSEITRGIDVVKKQLNDV